MGLIDFCYEDCVNEDSPNLSDHQVCESAGCGLCHCGRFTEEDLYRPETALGFDQRKAEANLVYAFGYTEDRQVGLTPAECEANWEAVFGSRPVGV